MAQTQWEGKVTAEVKMMMMAGCNVHVYEGPASNPIISPTCLFFSKKGGKFGSIYWCARGTVLDDPSKCLLVHQLTDIYIGKQLPIFTSSAAAKAAEFGACFSIITRNAELHVQSESTQVQKDWMVGIRHVLTSAGREVIVKQETGEIEPPAIEPSGRRLSRRLSATPRGKSIRVKVDNLAQGALFQKFTQKKHEPTRSFSTQIFLFHSRSVPDNVIDDNNGSAGALFWYLENGANDQTEDQSCMPLHTITDIVVGKQGPIFSTVCANACDDSRVFTIIGTMIRKKKKEESFSLHLEAESDSMVTEWVDGLLHLFKQCGYEAKSQPAPSSSLVGTARHLRIVKRPSYKKEAKPVSNAKAANAPTSGPTDPRSRKRPLSSRSQSGKKKAVKKGPVRTTKASSRRKASTS